MNGSLCQTNAVVVMLDIQYCAEVAKKIGVVGIRRLDGLYLELVASFVAVPRTRSQNLAFYRTANSGERQLLKLTINCVVQQCAGRRTVGLVQFSAFNRIVADRGVKRSWRLHVKPKLTRKPGC